ncbi:ankyrin repeat domain-containing protein [Microbacterium neungamense]|uniref:ankyrin repeat domain-containing protein n=1 Tax=Microbacterium neungamense TaxID=2810535 RepID=UPI003D8154AA
MTPRPITPYPRFPRAIALLAGVAAAVLVACAPAAPDRSGPSGPSGPSSSASAASDQQQRLDAQLREAAWADDVETAADLIARGADVNAKDDTQQSAYLIATSEGHLELLRLTLAHGAVVDDKDSWNGTGLIRAAERGHGYVVGELLRAGIDRDHVNRIGYQAIHEAVIFGEDTESYATTVRALIAGGVELDRPSGGEGWTPREMAEQRGLEGLRAILEHALRPGAVGSGRRPARRRPRGRCGCRSRRAAGGGRGRGAGFRAAHPADARGAGRPRRGGLGAGRDGRRPRHPGRAGAHGARERASSRARGDRGGPRRVSRRAAPSRGAAAGGGRGLTGSPSNGAGRRWADPRRHPPSR